MCYQCRVFKIWMHLNLVKVSCCDSRLVIAVLISEVMASIALGNPSRTTSLLSILQHQCLHSPLRATTNQSDRGTSERTTLTPTSNSKKREPIDSSSDSAGSTTSTPPSRPIKNGSVSKTTKSKFRKRGNAPSRFSSRHCHGSAKDSLFNGGISPLNPDGLRLASEKALRGISRSVADGGSGGSGDRDNGIDIRYHLTIRQQLLAQETIV